MAETTFRTLRPAAAGVIPARPSFLETEDDWEEVILPPKTFRETGQRIVLIEAQLRCLRNVYLRNKRQQTSENGAITRTNADAGEFPVLVRAGLHFSGPSDSTQDDV